MQTTCNKFQVTIHSCKDLIPSDANGKTDSYVVVGLLQGEHDRESFGKTAVVENQLNPNYPDNIIVVPYDPSRKLYLDVYDEDPLKDDRTCGLKIGLDEVVGMEPVTFEKELNKKGGYKAAPQNPTITFTIFPLIPEEPKQDEPEPQPEPQPEPSEFGVGKLEVEGENKYEYNVLVVDLDEKKFWVSEKSLPDYVEKSDMQYKFGDVAGKNLIVVPFIRTSEPFKKGSKYSVAFGQAKIEGKQIYRGEFSLGVIKVAEGKFELLDKKYIINRKNYQNDKWVEAFSEEVIPKAEYKEQ